MRISDEDIDVLAEIAAAGRDRARLLLGLRRGWRGRPLLCNLDTAADAAELGGEAGLLGGAGCAAGGGRLRALRCRSGTRALQLRKRGQKIAAWSDCHDPTIKPEAGMAPQPGPITRRSPLNRR